MDRKIENRQTCLVPFNNFFISGWLLLPSLPEHSSMMHDVLFN